MSDHEHHRWQNGAEIQRLRSDLGASREEFMEMMGVRCPGTLARWERGQRKPLKRYWPRFDELRGKADGREAED